MKQIEFGGNE